MKRKDVTIYSVAAKAGARAPLPYRNALPGEIVAPSRRAPTVYDLLREAVLFDPDRPHMGPNELAKEVAENPNLIQFNCPLCHKSYGFELFKAHLVRTKEGPGCMERWYKTIDITKRTFAGASTGDTNE